MSLASNFAEIVRAFNKNHVEYMIAGAYAVNYHGYNRSTDDFDIWVKPTEENKGKIVNALNQIGFTSEDIKKLKALDFAKPFSFAIGQEPIKIDIFNFITGVTYDEAERNKITIQYQ